MRLFPVLCGMVLLLGGQACLAADPPITIVRKGASDYVIVTSEKPSPAEALAAEELARYLKQMSGADLPIRAVNPAQAPARAITLGVEFYARAKTVPWRTVQVDDDAYRIEIRGQQIALTGFSDRAILHAAYAFLQSLGCRFLAPQLDFYHGAAEVIPKQSTITYSAGAISSRPVMIYRKLYVEEGHSHNATNLRQMIQWMPKAGYNVLVVPTNYQGGDRVKWDNWRAELTPELQKRGILIEVGGHGYQNFLNADMPAPDQPGKTLFEVHPQWFARDENGVRRREHNWVFNTANEDAVKFLAGNIARYVAARPEIQIFDLWPPDGERWDQSPQGQSQGTPTDRMVILTNRVHKELAQVRPDLRLECIAYARYTEPPQKQKLDPSVLVDFCPINQSFEVPISDPSDPRNAAYARDLGGWRKAFGGDISLYSYYRKYAWQSLPVILPHYMQQDLTFYAALPIQGISSYAEPGDWFTSELNCAALAKLAWDPKTDVDRFIAEFCAARYGQAAPVAIAAFAVLGDVVRKEGSIPNTSLKSAEQVQDAITRLAQAIKPLAAAEAAAGEPVRSSLERLGLMCDYAMQDLQIQQLRARHAPADPVRQAVEQLHQFLVQHQDDGVFLINGTRLSESSLLRRYGVADKPARRRASTRP